MTTAQKKKPMFRPLRDGVLIQRDNDVGHSGLILLSRPEILGAGVVVAVGPGAWARPRKVSDTGASLKELEDVVGREAATSARRIPMTVKVGDHVAWNAVEGMEFFTFDGKCQVLLAEHHLVITEAVDNDTIAA